MSARQGVRLYICMYLQQHIFYGFIVLSYRYQIVKVNFKLCTSGEIRTRIAPGSAPGLVMPYGITGGNALR